jgi:hypothetical protein
VKISAVQRQVSLAQDFEKHKNVVVSGSLVSWGTYWETVFDLAVFLYLPMEIRMKRLERRETDRYGELLISDKITRENSKKFLEWAKAYDDNNFEGRSKRIHRNWMKSLTCPVLELTGDMELLERMTKFGC